MTYEPIPLPDRMDLPDAEMIARAEAFHDEIRRRHTVRDFSDRPVPRAVLVGHPAADAVVPRHAKLKKPLDAIASFR